MDILEHLIPFGQEACPDWVLKRKVTKRPAHGDTSQLPPGPGRCLNWFSLNRPHPGVHCPLGMGSGARTSLMPCCSGLMSLQGFDLYENMMSPSFWPCWVWAVERNVLLETG